MTQDILTELNVSRETQERLREFADLVLKWTVHINLISKSTYQHVWDRHILDSLQVARCGYPCNHWVDIGSGGGFPGLVVAIFARQKWPNTQFTLIESDQRKSTFLRTVIRELDLNAKVLVGRIEQAPSQHADILSARALSDLTTLLDHARRHLGHGGVALYQKGARWEKELSDAKQAWKFECEAVKSETQDDAVILKIKGVSRD